MSDKALLENLLHLDEAVVDCLEHQRILPALILLYSGIDVVASLERAPGEGVGQRAMWQLAISPHTYQEIVGTQDPHRRHHLESWFGELWQYWRDIVRAADDLPTFIEAEDARVGALASGIVDVLPDLADRVLLCDAVVYRCELFCTRDWSTILKHRSKLGDLPFEIVTPTEWWEKIRPYAGLWV